MKVKEKKISKISEVTIDNSLNEWAKNIEPSSKLKEVNEILEKYGVPEIPNEKTKNKESKK